MSVIRRHETVVITEAFSCGCSRTWIGKVFQGWVKCKTVLDYELKYEVRAAHYRKNDELNATIKHYEN